MIALRAWSNGDFSMLEKTVGNRVMMEHLGEIEDRKQILRRHERYLDASAPEKSSMFTISLAPDAASVGTIGYWETTWQGERIYETGWMVLPEFAGRGIATDAASAIVERTRALHRNRFLHAFPSVANIASNAVCKKAGFAHLGECVFEYPKGTFMRCNDWRIDLFAGAEAAIR